MSVICFCRKRRRWRRRREGKTAGPGRMSPHLCCHGSAAVCTPAARLDVQPSLGAAGLPVEGWTRCSGAVGFESTRSRLWTVHSTCFSGRRRPRDSSPGPPRNGVEPDSRDSQVSGPAPRQSPTQSGCEFMNGATSWKRTGVFAPPSPQQSLSVRGRRCSRLVFIEPTS